MFSNESRMLLCHVLIDYVYHQHGTVAINVKLLTNAMRSVPMLYMSLNDKILRLECPRWTLLIVATASWNDIAHQFTFRVQLERMFWYATRRCAEHVLGLKGPLVAESRLVIRCRTLRFSVLELKKDTSTRVLFVYGLDTWLCKILHEVALIPILLTTCVLNNGYGFTPNTISNIPKSSHDEQGVQCHTFNNMTHMPFASNLCKAI